MLFLALICCLSAPGDVIRRSQHYTDIQAPGGKVTRRIQNNANWQDGPGGSFLPSDDNAEPAELPAPANWQGVYDFKRRLHAGPVQIYVGDSTDNLNTALIGLRLSASPDKWLNFKLLNVNAVEPDFVARQRATIWPGIQQNLAMVVAYRRAGIVTAFRVSGARANDFVRLAVRQPVGFGFTITDNAVSFTDSAGVEYMRNGASYGVSGTMAGPDEGNGTRFSVVTTEGAPVTVGQKTFRTIAHTWDASAVAAILAGGGIAWIE